MAEINELGIIKSQVFVFFPRDLVQEGLGQEIIIFVRGLVDKPERTAEIRNKLCKKLVGITKVFFPKPFVEVLPDKFNPADGFWSSLESE